MKRIIKILTVIGSMAALGFVCMLLFIAFVTLDLPDVETLSKYRPPEPSRILSAEGEVLLEVGKERREIVEIKDVPKRVSGAFLAAEDSDFYSHDGINYLGIARAMKTNILAGKFVQGGSTITQQVAKMLLLTRKKKLSRKVKEFFVAQKIENRFSKDQILFLYLNEVYLGGGYYGIKSAFKGYFGKELEEVTVAEAALVAGLLVAPSRYNPYSRPKKSKSRQNYVLKRMFETGRITKEEYEAAVAETILLKEKEYSKFKAPYFTDWVRQEVVSKLGEEAFLSKGLEITTTLNWQLQQVAEANILKGVSEIDKRQGFKGPVDHLESENIADYLLTKRNIFLKSKSKYFKLYPDGHLSSELDDQILTVPKDSGLILTGYEENELVLKYLNEEDVYNAVVIKVDDNENLIYISTLGVQGIIPYEYFRWAHKREISDTRSYWSWVRHPSSILKIGDIIKIKVVNKNADLTKEMAKDYYQKIKDSKNYQELFTKKFLLCSLEQDVEAQAALVSLNPTTGEVLSMVGGANFEVSQYNRSVQSNRQPGSSFKPFVYAFALENGFVANSILLDSPQALGVSSETDLSWQPRSDDGKFIGEGTLRNALEVSRNIPTIKIVQELGVSNFIDFARRIGVTTSLPQDLSTSLGSFGMNLVDLVKIYSIFPSGGKKVTPQVIKSVVDNNGTTYDVFLYKQKDTTKPIEEIPKVEEKPILEIVTTDIKEEIKTEATEEKINQFLADLNEDQVYDERLAYIMTSLLKGVVHHGTGRGARSISEFLGGKTGTTNNFVDAWFVGFSSNVVTGVWSGFDDNKTLGWGETGAKAALPIWTAYMKAAVAKYGEQDFKIPEGIVNVPIDKDTGKRSANTNSSFLESFVEGTEPKTADEILEKSDESSTEDNDEDYLNHQ